MFVILINVFGVTLIKIVANKLQYNLCSLAMMYPNVSTINLLIYVIKLPRYFFTSRYLSISFKIIILYHKKKS